MLSLIFNNAHMLFRIVKYALLVAMFAVALGGVFGLHAYDVYSAIAGGAIGAVAAKIGFLS